MATCPRCQRRLKKIRGQKLCVRCGTAGPRQFIDVGWPIKFCNQASPHECRVKTTPRLTAAIHAATGW